jgi:hypothetical protein
MTKPYHEELEERLDEIMEKASPEERPKLMLHFMEHMTPLLEQAFMGSPLMSGAEKEKLAMALREMEERMIMLRRMIAEAR